MSSESNRPNSGYIFYCRVLLTCLEAANSTTTPSSKSTTAGHHVYDMKIENVKLDNAAAKEKEEEREGGQHYSSTSTTDYSLPFQFTQLTTNGSIISVQFDKDETEEVANLKKGIASSFNIRLKFDDQGKAVSSETGAFGTHNVRYSAIRSNVSSNLIAIISQYNEGDITDYSSAVKISKASFSMASKSRALWDEGAGMLKKSIERTRILFNRPPPPASYSPSAHKIKTSSQDYTERNYVNDDLDDNNSQISVYASADLIWVESIDRLHDHHEQEDSLIQGDLLDNSVILADDVSAPAMEHDKMILEEGSLVADNWIQVPSTTLDRHTLNLKKRGFPDSSSSSCYSSSLQTDTLVHRLTSSTKDHHHHRRLLQKRSLELFSSSSDHITSIMDKISSDPAKHQDLSQELLKLTRSNPELIVPHLIRRTNSATLTSTGGSRLFKRTNTFSNSSCLQEAQRSSIKPFLPHLAASGNNKAHRQLINLIKTNFDCAGQSAKIALAFAPSVSRETFEFAVDELDGENDPTHLGFFSSLLRFQTRTTAQDFLASHLERFEGIIKHSTISWSKNSSSSAAAYFNTELLDSLLSHIDSFSNLSHSQHGDLVIDALLKSTRHPSKIIQTTAIESLGQFKGDTGEMRIEEEEKKRKEEKMMETTSRSELRRREYSGSQRLQKRAIMETSQWNHGSEMYDYIVPSSEAAEDVERYPYNRGYLWGSRVGTTDINVRFSSGTFLGLPDSGCDASGVKQI